MTTLTTVGYGDVVPVNTKERVVACFVMVMGAICFSVTIDSMSKLVKRLSEHRLKAKERSEQVLLARGECLCVLNRG